MFFKKKINQGFTLIELLVVVSIISLLSSVILAGVKEARKKAQDSKVVTQLLQMKNTAELSNSGSGYGVATNNNSCGTTMVTALTNGKFFEPSSWPSIDGVNNLPVCYSNAQTGQIVTAYSIWRNLNNSRGWCIDNEGSSLMLSTAPNSYDCEVSGGGGGTTLANGLLCESNDQCLSNYCNPSNVCATYGSLEPGQACSVNEDCASQYCDGYTCGAY